MPNAPLRRPSPEILHQPAIAAFSQHRSPKIFSHCSLDTSASFPLAPPSRPVAFGERRWRPNCSLSLAVSQRLSPKILHQPAIAAFSQHRSPKIFFHCSLLIANYSLAALPRCPLTAKDAKTREKRNRHFRAFRFFRGSFLNCSFVEPRLAYTCTELPYTGTGLPYTGTGLAYRGTDIAYRGTDIAYRGTDIAYRGTESSVRGREDCGLEPGISVFAAKHRRLKCVM
jgi:hypothetical protein